jgi:seryl-tRNA synthetase
MDRMSRWGFALLAALWLAPAPVLAQDTKLDRALEEQTSANQDAQGSEKRIEGLDDETQRLLTEYRRALTDAESYRTYANQLEAQVQSQHDELAEMDRQLLEVETTSREVLPLMQNMLATLDQFVKLDVPFLLDERTKRVATLTDMMSRADVTISEKYRLVLDAYQSEIEYGRTVQAYEGHLGTGANARTVEFARLGRVSLMYRTLDGSETGYWDAQKKDWVQDASLRGAVEEALRVAKEDGPPELLTVPVPAPQEVRS